MFLVSLLHQSSHVNREKRIKTKEQTTNAQLCPLQGSSKRGTLQQRPPDSSGVWATLPFAAAVVTKSSNSLMLPQRLAAEPQRVVFSLTPFSAAEPQLRRNIDVSLCVLAPQAVVDPRLAQVSKKPRHQIKSGTSEHCFIAELWHHPDQSKLKIKPFMSAYLSAWETRLTQGTVHSAMRSGPRPSSSPCTAPTLHHHFSSARNGVRASVCVCLACPVSATAVHFVLLLKKHRQDFRARERQRSKKRQQRMMARVARFACHQSSLRNSRQTNRTLDCPRRQT